ncbi:MAG: IPT/TIG domain-containing protein [Dehalococcoidia bacterium]
MGRAQGMWDDLGDCARLLHANSGPYSLALGATNPCAALPTVGGISALSGPAAGGTQVTITGTGFSTTAGDVKVRFGLNAATNVSCSSTTSCTATSPAGSSTVDLRVVVLTTTTPASGADEFSYGVLGDVNGDNAMTAVDALCLLRSVAALSATAACRAIPLTEPSDGDVNRDGSVTAVDALCILRSVARLPGTAVCPAF